MDAVIRRRLLISGRVQGVWYRDSCRTEAERLGVAGWVRNLPDGRVEVVVEGDPGSASSLEAWCATGPPRAVVVRVDGSDEEPEALSDFTVL